MKVNKVARELETRGRGSGGSQSSHVIVALSSLLDETLPLPLVVVIGEEKRWEKKRKMAHGVRALHLSLSRAGGQRGKQAERIWFRYN